MGILEPNRDYRLIGVVAIFLSVAPIPKTAIADEEKGRVVGRLLAAPVTAGPIVSGTLISVGSELAGSASGGLAITLQHPRSATASLGVEGGYQFGNFPVVGRFDRTLTLRQDVSS
jgi:hypothetical protein